MNPIDNQVEYWDRVAREKTFSHPLDLKLLKKHVSAGRRILDFGCGYGRICSDLWNNGFRNVVGVDSSPEMIKRGRLENPHLDLDVLKESILPFPDGSFDAVLLFIVLTCIPTDEGQRRIIGECFRVLRPGGILYISDLPLQEDERNQRRYRKWADTFGIYGVFQLPEGAVCRHHDMTWIETLTGGFDTIQLTEIDVMTMNNNQARAFQYFGRKPA